MEVVASNSPDTVEARAWLNAHKEETGESWPALGKLTDLASSTLGLFASGKYTGNNETVATKVLAYRARLTSQAEIGADVPTVPQWYETPTSKRLTSLFKWAQSGEIVLIITTPGIGKTRAAERFEANDPNVWLATMSPSAAGVSTMLVEVAAAIGLGEVKGTPQQLNRQIKARVKGKKGLLIVDEAQELNDKALNELRHIHDLTGLGIVIMGNEVTVGQIASKKVGLAQISSRVSVRHLQGEPMAGDVDALLDAWGITAIDQRSFLAKVGATPGALREITHTIKVAAMAAQGAGKALTLAGLRDAARQRSVRIGNV